jgi:S-adenosylmethionine hydrolase
MKVALAVSQGNFAERYGLNYGSDWEVEFTK